MRLPYLLIVVVILGCVVSRALGSEIKLALFSTFERKECFLSEAELDTFLGVLARIKRDADATRGKFIPQEFVFYYWEYIASEKELKKRSISFAANGRSINWKISESDSRIIQSLTQQLLERAKKSSTPQP